MDWKGFIEETNGQLAELRAAAPDAMAGFSALAKAATKPGVLDAKTKELIALGIGIHALCDGCVAFHTKALVRLGTTRDEIAETVAMAVYMGGGPALMYGAKALDAFDAQSAGAADRPPKAAE